MARLTLILGVLATVIYLLDGFRFMLNEWRNWRNKGTWLAVLGLCLMPSMANAAPCTGSGLTWTCPAGATSAEVNTMISSATTGATATFASGAYSWSTVTLSETKGITLICQTLPPNAYPWGAATSGGCNVAVTARIGIGTYVAATYTQFYRISGFNFTSTIGSMIHWGYGCNPPSSCSGHTDYTQVRIDHNTFSSIPTNATLIRLGEFIPINHVWGLIDHNYAISAGSFGLALQESQGDNATSHAGHLGTVDNMFFEDNVLISTTGTNEGRFLMDSWGGHDYVWRYNTSLNGVLGAHGVLHSWGPTNVEVYNNTFSMDINGDIDSRAGYRFFFHQGSGEFMMFNNSLLPYGGHSATAINVTHYRAADPVEGGYGDPPGRCDGTKGIDGNRVGQSGWPCKRQPGRDINATLRPMYIWNNYFSDTLAKVPLVVSNHWTGPPFSTTHIQADRDYYNSVSKDAQTSNTFPFDGTTGMGFGTHISPDYRPTTCTTTGDALDAGNGGVGYYATDENILYMCTATDTWTAYYTPFTYPHPLTSGDIYAASAAFTPAVIARVVRWMEVAAFVTGMGWHFRKQVMAVSLAAIAGCGTLYQLAPRSYETVKVVSKDSAVKVLTVFNDLTKPRE